VVTELNPNAFEIATALDTERAQGRVRGYDWVNAMRPIVAEVEPLT